MSRLPPPSPPSEPPPGAGAAAAADWVWRIDRGLSPAEQDQFFEWLAADPAHADALARCRRHWRRLDKLVDWRPEHSRRPNPDLLAPPPSRRSRRLLFPLALAAAAGVAGSLFLWNSRPVPAAEVALLRHEDRRMLPDASSVVLNAQARITVLYTAAERRIRLERGEAFFTVVKDPARPFVVEAGGVEVRAVGTAFDVHLADTSLDVIVTTGVVALTKIAPAHPGGAAAPPRPELAVLQAHQRMTLALEPQGRSGRVVTLTRREIQSRLAWQHGLMTFREERLAAIVAELNRLNESQLVLVDDALADTLFSGTIRSDNVDGFARLLQSGFGAEVERVNGDEIRLRTKKASNQ